MNQSSQPIQLELSPPNSGPFAVGPLPSGSVAAGASVALNAIYSPTQVESDNSSFALTGCVGCTRGIVVPLKGMGVATALSYPNPLSVRLRSPAELGAESLGPSEHRQPFPPDHLGPDALSRFLHAACRSAAGLCFQRQPGRHVPVCTQRGHGSWIYPSPSPPSIGGLSRRYGRVLLQSTDPNLPQVTITLEGYGGGARINCQPGSLDLGPVAVSYSTSQSLFCFNAGTDIPGHPEAALQLTQSLLGIDNPDFSATLLNAPDGGLSLSAGQSAVLRVTFSPPDANDGGIETATLEVGSNDVAHNPLPVPLTGRAVIPGPCAAAVLPPGGLHFGEVPKGGEATLQFAIQNQGSNTDSLSRAIRN